MECYIFKSIQIPGAMPSNANWSTACSIDELSSAMFEDSNDSPLCDDDDKLLYDAMNQCESNPFCILNGTKWKLLCEAKL